MRKFVALYMMNSTNYGENDGGGDESTIDEVEEEHVLQGALQAFRVSTDSIFKHNLLLKKSGKVVEGGGGTVVEKGKVLDLKNLLDANLATFFEKAIATISKNKNWNIEHEILDVSKLSIVHSEVLFSGFRGMKRLGEDLDIKRVDRFFGIVSIILRELPDDDQKTIDQAMDTNFYATIRLKVDIHCRELFFIEDTAAVEGQQLLQGNKAPVERVHQVLIEKRIDLRRKDVYDWQLVDIDNWMAGNKFWVLDKIEKKREEDQ